MLGSASIWTARDSRRFSPPEMPGTGKVMAFGDSQPCSIQKSLVRMALSPLTSAPPTRTSAQSLRPSMRSTLQNKKEAVDEVSPNPCNNRRRSQAGRLTLPPSPLSSFCSSSLAAARSPHTATSPAPSGPCRRPRFCPVRFAIERAH